MTRCKAQVSSYGGWPSVRCCTRKAVTEDGYCKQHDPEHQRKQQEKRDPTKSEQGANARKRLDEILERLGDTVGEWSEGAALVKEAKGLRHKLWW